VLSADHVIILAGWSDKPFTPPSSRVHVDVVPPCEPPSCDLVDVRIDVHKITRPMTASHTTLALRVGRGVLSTPKTLCGQTIACTWVDADRSTTEAPSSAERTQSKTLCARRTVNVCVNNFVLSGRQGETVRVDSHGVSTSGCCEQAPA
jgi:hypothetical protein